MPGYLQHLQSLSQSDLEDELQTAIKDQSGNIVNSEEFSAAQAGTNATFASIDEVEILNVTFTSNECKVSFSFRSEGEQDQDATFSGDVITGEGEAVFDDEEQLKFRDLSAEVEPSDDPDDE